MVAYSKKALSRSLGLGALGSGAGWTSRRAITVDNTGNASTLTDFQTKIALTSANFDFSLAKTDGSDIRLTDADGTTQIPFWIEAYDSVGQTATIWTKVPSITGSASKTIYIYYGKASAASIASGANTFQLFDDFNTLTNAWGDYASNPVLSPALAYEGTYVRDPFVMYENGTFKMMYWGSGGNLGYATSPDGFTWTKVSQVNVSGCRPSVVKKGSTYYLFTNDPTQTKIQVATGSNFEGPYSGQVDCLTPNGSGWEGSNLYVPSVIWDTDDNTWKMWYSGGTYTVPSVGYDEPKYVGYATNTNADPSSGWVKYGSNPILSPAADNSWYHSAIQLLRVTKISGIYYGLYTGADGAGASRNGFVSTTNPTSWTLDPTQMIQDTGPAGSWFQDNVYAGTPLYVNGTWYHYFNGRVHSTDTEKTGVSTLQASLSNTLDTSKWKASRRSAVTVSSSIATIDGSSGAQDAWLFSHTKLTNAIFEARTRIKTSGRGAFALSDLGARFNGSYYDPIAASWGSNTMYESLIMSGSTTANKLNTLKFVNGTETTLNSSTQTISLDTWYIQGLYLNGTTIKSYLDRTQVYSSTDSAISASGFMTLRAFQAKVDVDWMLIRQYTSPEPSTSLGAREAVNQQLAA